MTPDVLTDWLESAWDRGFLWDLRQGSWEASRADEFLSALRSAKLTEQEFVPRRLVSLLWYIPLFLSWQDERVSGFIKRDDYLRYVNQVTNEVERLLGLP